MNLLISDISFLSLNNFDFLMFGIIGFSALFAIVRGFLKSFISFAGWVLSMAIGMKFYFLLEPIVSKYVTLGVVAAVIAGISLFLISSIIIAIINNIFYICFEAISGGLLDRSIGLLFGLLRGCLLVSFTFYILLMIMPQLGVKDAKELKNQSASSAYIPHWAKNSKTILLLNRGSLYIDEIMPLDFRRKLKEVLSNGGTIEKEKDVILNEKPEHHAVGQDAIVINTNEDSIPMILDLLPKEIMDKISQEDLALLHNKASEPQEKIRVLEEISKAYQEYVNNTREKQDQAQEDTDKKNLEYYKLMSLIENRIMEYNR
jgi:membrane protein required for colicin V production